MLERLEVAYVRSATHQIDKRKTPESTAFGFQGNAVFSDSTSEQTVYFWKSTGLTM